ncbi:MAG: carboxypeptidase-like regulatory domain-containing protein [Candidatus Solibacter sp.]
MRRCARYLACLAAFVAFALAQSRNATEIRGVVLEAGSQQPVPDAEIALFVQAGGAIRINGGWKLDETRKAHTDFSGAFRLAVDKAGEYRVEAKKSGYATPGAGNPPNSADVRVTDTPAENVRLYLVLPGRITGRVVDADSGAPVGGLPLNALRETPSIGFGFTGPAGVTTASGEFEIGGLSAGEYAVEVRPRFAEDQRVSARKPAAAKSPEHDWEHSYWPGGHGAESAIPVTVIAGANTDVGRITARKVPYYWVHLRIPGDECRNGEKLAVTEAFRTARGGQVQHRLATTACANGLYVAGFPAGTWRLMLRLDGSSALNPPTALLDFTVKDENLELDVPFMRGVTVDGALVAAEGTALPDMTKVRVGLRPNDGFLATMESSAPALLDQEGRFQVQEVRLTTQTVRVTGLDAGHYVKEIRYNGALAAADEITLQSGAMAHKVNIVLDDKPGAIIGSVLSGEQPVSGAVIIARRWPPAKEQSGLAGGRSDAMGQFRVGGLAPGEYHVIALRTLGRGQDESIERALAAAPKTEVTASGVASLRLEVQGIK